MTHPILVVGVGGDGPASLSEATRQRIAQADWLWGSARLLSFWSDHPAAKTVITASALDQLEQLRSRGDRRVVILASGDPGFYGVAGTLLRHFPCEEVEIIPHVSMLQLAFARARMEWSDAIFTSAHARPLSEVVGWAKRAAKLGILTDSRNTPAVIARALLAAGLDDCRAIVAENLGLPEERLVDTCLTQLVDQEFAPLNVLLLIRDAAWRPHPMFILRPDAAYRHRDGMITKAETRALSLAALALAETDTVWDIGAGSGAMSIECAQVAWRGQVFAIERASEGVALIRDNLARFGVLNVTVVEGEAPQALEGLPPPHAVFIGGSGGKLAAILEHVSRVASPGCRLVLTLATLEHLHQAKGYLDALGWITQLLQVNIARGQPIGEGTRLAPLNPVFLLIGNVRCVSSGGTF
ncbi:MAG: precorrin-6y C5,15-methyltransferase (decarboxylating) subunit CbiE [Anaerolineae bacterium]|nr:precorrin-6y C5,15-methyltransferase (decarboxylating) subunit CbiE [Anaerolineae bacterium]